MINIILNTAKGSNYENKDHTVMISYTNSLYTISDRYVYAYGSSNVVKETVSISAGEI